MPEGDNKFVMRCGGFAAVFFTVLFLFACGTLVMAFRDGPGKESLVAFYLELALFAGFALYAPYYLLVQKVEIDGDKLNVAYLFRTLWPTRWSMYMSDIRAVTLGPIGQLKREHPELVKAPRLQTLIAQYETLGRGGSRPVSVAFTPIIVVQPENVEDAQVIITKPFSRSACRALMAEFRARGIRVQGDERL